MTQSASEPQRHVDSHGAVDLSGLGADAQAAAPAPSSAAAGAAGAAGGGSATGKDSWCVRVDAQQLQQVVQLSAQAPVIVLIHDASAASETMKATLEDLVDAQQGRLLLAEIDAASSPELANSAEQLPVATAFIGGRPVGEFDSSAASEQLGQVVTQLVQMATQNGMTQQLPPQSQRAAAEGEEAEEELPVLHQKAHAAIESQDYDAAAAAFHEALRENPGDEDARLGLAQVGLLQRTRDMDVSAVRTAAAERPDDVAAQIAVSDLDVLGGHVEDAFNRLISFIQKHPADGREEARVHLIELYSIVGDTDPRVSASRRKLARALF